MLSRATGFIVQRSSSRSPLSTLVFAEQPSLNNRIDYKAGTQSAAPIKSAHIFQGTIHCQINDKNNPAYCLVLQLGIDPWCAAMVQVFIVSLKPLGDLFPNKKDGGKTGEKNSSGFSDYIFCDCLT